jgi:hypothetical protein
MEFIPIIIVVFAELLSLTTLTHKVIKLLNIFLSKMLKKVVLKSIKIYLQDTTMKEKSLYIEKPIIQISLLLSCM